MGGYGLRATSRNRLRTVRYRRFREMRPHQWQGGFQGEVSVTAGPSAIRGWTVKWTLPSGLLITR
ncbi:hypothetical protein Mth01_28860 [Sphaerimonospora thailandensis]|uniref:CBM2 domain-containing protein n=1 Tax=Sphaerimonospora thailandensis TaxID=795644 RepID=A0A8J3RDT5_9ACTN|nr:hypothetical protein Mth01_28860 [Sphaerimonospora thailandensis]